MTESNVIIDKLKLQELWCKGIVNDLSYITFALQLQSKPNLDMLQFSREWSIEELSDEQSDDGWKAKKLKVRSILNAICILDEKNALICSFNASVSQLSIF